MAVFIDDEEYYTAAEACRALGVKQATLYSYVNRGLVTSYKQGIQRRRLYKRAEVDALLTVSPVPRGEAMDIPLAELWATEH